ncbi:MAG: aminopeptidase [Anaerolineae bacterium]
MTTDLELTPGAKRAVNQCLAIDGSDRVFIMTDEETIAIGEALAAAARDTRARVEVAKLEDFGPRPLDKVPPGLTAALKAFAPTATFFAAQGQKGEIGFRIALGRMLRRDLEVRHGHMIGIDAQLMVTGMAANYYRVADRTNEVNECVAGAREIRVTNADGTDLVVRLDPDHLRWNPCTGLYHKPGQWGNLPEGETFTSPADVEGTLTANLLGDHFSRKYGLLTEPAVFTIEDAHVTALHHPSGALVRDVRAYLDSARNGTRVGEFAVGTNEALTELTGNMLQDEKFPGVHVAFGNPYPDITGASWSSEIHVDVVPLKVNIWVDGREIMAEGRFTL